jgi:hypothetical protein
MRRHIRQPSASTAVALLALFVALGGTGYAAVKVNGKTIKTRTITGKKFKNNTLTGKQIKESKLATVPKAKLATTATTAGTANALAGGAAAELVRPGKVLDTNLVKLTAVGTSAGTSPLRTVFTQGPFALQAACWNAAGGQTALRLRYTSSEAGSIVNGELLPLDDTVQDVSAEPDDQGVALAAPSGATLATNLYFGIKALGADCVVATNGVVSP